MSSYFITNYQNAEQYNSWIKKILSPDYLHVYNYYWIMDMTMHGISQEFFNRIKKGKAGDRYINVFKLYD